MLADLYPPVSDQQAEEGQSDGVLEESNLPGGKALMFRKSNFHLHETTGAENTLSPSGPAHQSAERSHAGGVVMISHRRKRNGSHLAMATQGRRYTFFNTLASRRSALEIPLEAAPPVDPSSDGAALGDSGG
jgi:hypothetical protein